jgi:ABC transport system ATP-binding/permease protein
MTGSLEKEKIAVEDGALVQIIDPVYKNSDSSNKIAGLGSHFLTSSKYLFGMLIPTYCFNLLVIWLMNALLFVVLYLDLFKRLFRKIK